MIEAETARPDGTSGRIPENIMHFTRTLRAAGLPLGPGQTLRAIEAIRSVEITDKRDFYWALRSSLINRHDQIELFDQAFAMFWRNPDILNRMMDMMLPTLAIGHLAGVMLYLAAYALATVAAMTLFTAGLGGLAKRLAKRSPQWGRRFGLACCTLTIFIGGFWLLA